MAKRVAVIGAGCSGLTAIKNCVDESLTPVCFERTDEPGGLWNFTEKVRDGQGCVMRSTVINTSKEMMSYSDFPIPKEFPNYLHNTQVWSYFKMYAKHFDLQKHILYNREVLSIQKAEDYDKTGRWEVRVRDHKTGSESTEVFDSVLVCTGHHASKNEPHFSGEENFQGKVLHSHDYKDWTGYMGKRVVVVGIGNSGGDIAVELSRVAKVYLSTRSGAWILNRVGDNGMPSDYARRKRFLATINSYVPTWYKLWTAESRLNKRFNHKLYSLQPNHRVSSQHPTVNDDLPNRIACGTVVVKADIKRFTKTGIEFVDGTVEEYIDVVILATGYIFGFPFIDKSVIDVQENRVELYKYMFPPNLKHQSLAVIGCIQPLGAIMPIAELQCRIATRVFKGECRLPTQDEMWSDIRKKQLHMAARYVTSQRHTIQVDYAEFMDELAEIIGVRPDLGKLFLKDPILALYCYFGTCTPYQYRLMGPGQWVGARDAILTQEERVRFPLQTRPLLDELKDGMLSQTWLLFLMFIAIAILYKLFL